MPEAEEAGPWDLERLAQADRLTDWMAEQFAPCAGGVAAEVGAGIGTFSARLLEAGVERLLLVEPDRACLVTLRRRFEDDPRVRIAADELPDSPALREAAGTLDFVLCQNVLEHLRDDAAAVATMAGALRPGGCLALLVPAHPRLYGRLDRRYGHFRRYDRDRLRGVVERSGLQVESLYSFNLLGVAGWWAKSFVGSERIDSRSLRTYERLLRAWRPLEDRVRMPWGLSLVVRARRR